MRKIHRNHGHTHSQQGMSLLELIIACTILMILSSAALPIARYTIVHKKEELLHYNLRQMRDAIDRYKDLADSNTILAAHPRRSDDRTGGLGIARRVG